MVIELDLCVCKCHSCFVTTIMRMLTLRKMWTSGFSSPHALRIEFPSHPELPNGNFQMQNDSYIGIKAKANGIP